MFGKADRQLLEQGLPPEQVADRVLQAIRDEKFHIMTHPEMKDPIRTRMKDILEERNPTFDPADLGLQIDGGK